MTRLFLIKDSTNCETINTFLKTLDQDKIKYTLNYKFEEGMSDILIIIDWENESISINSELNTNNTKTSKNKKVSIDDILKEGRVIKKSLAPEEMEVLNKYIKARVATCGCDPFIVI